MNLLIDIPTTVHDVRHSRSACDLSLMEYGTQLPAHGMEFELTNQYVPPPSPPSPPSSLITILNTDMHWFNRHSGGADNTLDRTQFRLDPRELICNIHSFINFFRTRRRSNTATEVEAFTRAHSKAFCVVRVCV